MTHHRIANNVRSRRRSVVLRLLLLFGLFAHVSSTAAESGLVITTFKTYNPLASVSELLRRLRSPLVAAKMKREAAAARQTLDGQLIDLTAERFAVYVPSFRPDRGYGVLVFVPPWQEPRMPPGWKAVFDRKGIIFVSAIKSGNAENAIGRRIPLALLAAQNIVQQYHVDADRLYVGGFSGGSRVALRVALGYPDVFKGAFLNAGSDPIGNADIPLPPKDLTFAFQMSSRLAFATGVQDTDQIAEDAGSVRSLNRWCATRTSNFVIPQTAHEVAPGSALQRALTFLEQNDGIDPVQLTECRSVIERELKSEVTKAHKLAADSKHERAQKAFEHIDYQFGGLAAGLGIQTDAM
jgi:dienelactone hydrolase